MEDVLNLMEKPATEKEPVVAIDERPVQLHATERSGRPMAPGRIAQRDYEYVRRGTANIFCIVAPKTGRHLTHATANRKARRFAAAMKRISDAYPDAKRIHIVARQQILRQPDHDLARDGPLGARDEADPVGRQARREDRQLEHARHG
jgi:glutamate/tyrosine decarboxylase-like PLP-dependent enzyme